MKNENDPIAEADVYIAYGRTAQAAEILQQAIKAQPAREAEFQAKLTEIRQSPSEEIIRASMPKIFWLPIAIGIILYFISLFIESMPGWPGWLVLFATAISVELWRVNQTKQIAKKKY